MRFFASLRDIRLQKDNEDAKLKSLRQKSRKYNLPCDTDKTCCMYTFLQLTEFKCSCRLKKNGMIMEKLKPYDIPFTIKAQVLKSNQVREGLR